MLKGIKIVRGKEFLEEKDRNCLCKTRKRIEMKTIIPPFPELSVHCWYPDSWGHLWDCRTCWCFPRSLRVLSGSPQAPLELRKNFHSDSDIPTVVACLLPSTLPVADFPCDLFKFLTLDFSLVVTGIGLKRCSESHCYLEEASGSWRFPLSAPVIEVPFTFTSCHCFSAFGLSFQLLFRRASLLIYSMVRSLLPLDRPGMERQCVHICPYLCGERRSEGLGRYFSCSSEQ